MNLVKWVHYVRGSVFRKFPQRLDYHHLYTLVMWPNFPSFFSRLMRLFLISVSFCAPQLQPIWTLVWVELPFFSLLTQFVVLVADEIKELLNYN